jgi:hypothetical protein
MKGSIQKKGKIYYAIGAIGDKREWFRGGPAKKTTRKVLTEILNEINQGTYREIPKTSFKKFAEIWLTNHAQVNIKPSSLARYRDIIHRLLLPSFGHHKLPNITTGHLQRYVCNRLKAVSPKTLSLEIVVIKRRFCKATCL